MAELGGGVSGYALYNGEAVASITFDFEPSAILVATKSSSVGALWDSWNKENGANKHTVSYSTAIYVDDTLGTRGIIQSVSGDTITFYTNLGATYLNVIAIP